MLERIKRNLKQCLLLLIAIGILIRSADCLLPLGRFIANINRSMRYSILDDYENDTLTKEAGVHLENLKWMGGIKRFFNIDGPLGGSSNKVVQFLISASPTELENFKKAFAEANTDDDIIKVWQRYTDSNDVPDAKTLGELKSVRDTFIAQGLLPKGKTGVDDLDAANAQAQKDLDEYLSQDYEQQQKAQVAAPDTVTISRDVGDVEPHDYVTEYLSEHAAELPVFNDKTPAEQKALISIATNGKLSPTDVYEALTDVLPPREYKILIGLPQDSGNSVNPAAGPFRGNADPSVGPPADVPKPTVKETLDSVRNQPTNVQPGAENTFSKVDELTQSADVNRNPADSITASVGPPDAGAPIGSGDDLRTILENKSLDDILTWIDSQPYQLSDAEWRIVEDVFERKAGVWTPDIESTGSKAVTNAGLDPNDKHSPTTTSVVSPMTFAMWIRRAMNSHKAKTLQEAKRNIRRELKSHSAALADFDDQVAVFKPNTIALNNKGLPGDGSGSYVGFNDKVDIYDPFFTQVDSNKPIFKLTEDSPNNRYLYGQTDAYRDNGVEVFKDNGVDVKDDGVDVYTAFRARPPVSDANGKLALGDEYRLLKRQEFDDLLGFMRKPFVESVDSLNAKKDLISGLYRKMSRGEKLTPDEWTTYRSIVKELPPEQVHSAWRSMWERVAGAGNTLNNGARKARGASRTASKAAKTVGKGLGKGWMSGAKIYDTLFIAPTRKLRAYRDAMKDNWLFRAGLFGVDPFGALYRSQSGLGFGARVLGDVGAGGLAYTFTGLPIFGGFLAASADQLGKGLQQLGEQDADDGLITRGFKLPLGWSGTMLRAAQWPFIGKKSLYYNWAGYGAEADSAQDYINKQQSWSDEAKKAVLAVADRSGWLLSSLSPDVRENTINNIYAAYQADPEKFLVSYNYMPQGDKGLIPWTASWLDYGGEIIDDGFITPAVNRMSDDDKKKVKIIRDAPEKFDHALDSTINLTETGTDAANAIKNTATNANETINGNGKNNPLTFLSNMNKNTQTWRNSMANWSAPIGLGPKSPYGATAGGALGGLLVGGAIGALRYALQDPEKMSELERKRRSLLKMMAQYGMYGATAAGAVGGAFDLAAYANNQDKSKSPAESGSVPAAAGPQQAYYAPRPSSPFASNSNPWSQSSYHMT